MCIHFIVDVSFGEKERKINRVPAGNRIQDLLNINIEPLDPRQRSGRKFAYNSHARGPIYPTPAVFLFLTAGYILNGVQFPARSL